ncbi:hypothetical protein HID58_053022, partial [Brassica napus]
YRSLGSNPDTRNLKTDVHKALEDYGCFEAFFDKVSVELDKSVFESMEELFDLPIQTKQRNVSYGPDHGNQEISETMHVFLKYLLELDVMVRKMILESFGIEKYIDEHLNSTNYLFRMKKYSPPPDNDGDDEETKLVIDFSDQCLTPGTSKWDKVKTDVRKALEDYGCFEAFFDKVSVELDKSVFEAMEELFDLPTQTKERNVSSKPYHGYLSQNIYESFGIDDANLAEKVNEFTQQLWPDHGNKRISETMHGISGKLAELDVMVRRMIMESFGIEKYIDEHLDSTNYLFRMMKYTPPPPHEEKKLGLPSHTDKNIMTILHQYQVEGLEIQNKDKKWFKVKPSHQYSFIVMVGDSMCAFLNGRLASTYHRVLVTAKKTRYSTALFSTPKTGVILDSPEELIDEEHPRVFKPFEFNDYRDFYNTEAGFGIDDTNLAGKVKDFTQKLWPDHGIKRVRFEISGSMHGFSKQLPKLDVMYSPPPDNDDGDDEETKLGLCSHTDKNTITVVHQYQVDGLEIKTKDEKWLKVTPSHHSFIIMDGDSLCVGSSTF